MSQDQEKHRRLSHVSRLWEWNIRPRWELTDKLAGKAVVDFFFEQGPIVLGLIQGPDRRDLVSGHGGREI